MRWTIASVSEVVGEDGAVRLQPFAQLDRVDEVPVVAERHRAAGVVNGDRLSVPLGGVARGRVAHVPDGGVARQLLEPIGGEDVVDVPHLPHGTQLFTVGGHDAGRFLPTVLEGVQAEIGQVRRFRVSKDSDHPTHGGSKLAQWGGNKRTRSRILRSQDFVHNPAARIASPPAPPTHS